MRIALPLILFAATLCFALGIVLPLIRVERLYFFTDEPSLAGIVLALWVGGDWLLAAAVGLFSIVFPSLKLALLHVAMHGGAETHARLPAWLRGLANWSMLDVLLVALVIFAAKTSGLATAFTKPGLWFFALSVVLTATATALLNRPSGAKGSAG
ncbi:paraquat-inducible protein A [Aquibium oceanicum]|uniref:Paraquat-inducible membrane protein A n=1 Tax=Aquibium oceanicum TaxID=1670800 RepID=A0A1L3SYH5_9HYPH|nr:paraquat-inducible protein A [Aquibium oceanicum]APH74483.1 paraquat-inducible membrane protein A [Aquibium oceanicum]